MQPLDTLPWSKGRTRTATCTAGEAASWPAGRGVILVRGVRGMLPICPIGVLRAAGSDGMAYRAAMLLAPLALLKPRLDVGGVERFVRGDSTGVVEDM